MDAATIRILVTADGTGVARGMTAAATAVTSFERSTKSALDRVKGSFAGLSNVQRILAGGALGLTVFAAALGAVIGPAIEFESAFAGVLKTVEGSSAQLDGIRTGLLDLSTVMPTSAVQLASIAENAGQLGVAAGDVLEFTEVVAQLGETTNLDFDSAAQSLARFMNVTGNDTSIRQLGDVIVELGNNSATTESEILTFAQRLASAFTVAGATEDEILALGAAFSSLGVEAEAGASSLNRVITQIADAAKLGGQDLEVFAETAGLLPDEFAAIARANPVEALVLFGEGLQRLTEEGRSITPVLEQLELSGIRTSRVLQLLALGGEGIRTSLRLAADQFENGGAAAEEYGRRAETTASRLEVLQGRIRAVAIELGTPALDTFARGADAAGDAIERLADLAAPVGAELVDLFTGAGGAADGFLSSLTGPSLTLAVGALEGIAGGLTSVLGALNAIDPRIALIGILAADIALVGPISQVAAAGLRSIGLGATFAATGVGSLSTAVSGLAIGAVIAGLIVFGDELETIGQKARRAGAEFESGFADALTRNDYQQVSDELSGIRDRIREIEATPGVNLDSGIGGFAQGLRNLADAANAFDDGQSVFELRAELEELQNVLDGTNADEYARGIERIAARLDISEDAAARYAAELGLVGDVIEAGTFLAEEWVFANNGAVDAIRLHTTAARALGDEQAILADKILAGTAGISDFVDALGVTNDRFSRLITLTEGVELEDFIDPDRQIEAFDAVNATLLAFERLAEQIGITAEEYEIQLESVIRLTEAHDALASAIAGANDAMASISAASDAAAEARERYNTAIENVTDEESFRAAATAASELTLALAGTGLSYGETRAAQQEFGEALIQLGRNLELTEDEIIEYGAALFGIPPAVITEIIALAENAINNVESFEERAEDVAREYIAEMDAETGEATGKIENLQALIDIFPGQSPYNADMTVDPAAAEASIIAAQALIDVFPGGSPYNADMTVDNSNALSETASAQGAIDVFPGVYTAELRAVDNASGTISSAVSALQGFVSRTITLTTRHITEYGGAFAGGGITGFDDGSISLFPRGAVRESPGFAQIYSPATPGRFFAEPETGGEAYIPLSSGKRQRSIAIWAQTGRILGVLANGGIQGYQDGGISTILAPQGATVGTRDPGLVFAPNVNLSFAPAGPVDERRLARFVADETERALQRAARDIQNRK